MALKREQDAKTTDSMPNTNLAELKVQVELRAHGLETLLQQHKLAAKRHARYPNLVLLKYAANDFNSEVMKECRGILLDESRNWEIVGCPFFKFMNQDERGADNIEWSRARVYEKLDGSICMLYFYDGKWNVASSGSPDASGNIGKETFEQVFWDVWKRVCMYQEPMDTGITYLFEMLSPRNQIVCSVPVERIVLLGTRRLSDLQEELPEAHADRYGWEVARSFPLASLADVLKAASALNGDKREDGKVPDEEGYVVCDMGNFNRVKVKSPKYVALAHLKGAAARKVLCDVNLLPLVMADEVEEMSAYFPHLRARLEELADAITALAESCARNNPIVKEVVAKLNDAIRGDASQIRSWLCVPGNVETRKLLKLLSVGFLNSSQHSSSLDQKSVAKETESAADLQKVQPQEETSSCIDTVASPQNAYKLKTKKARVEKRPDPNAWNGESYTRDEFLQYYGVVKGDAVWEAAASSFPEIDKRLARSSGSGRRRKR